MVGRPRRWHTLRKLAAALSLGTLAAASAAADPPVPNQPPPLPRPAFAPGSSEGIFQLPSVPAPVEPMPSGDDEGPRIVLKQVVFRGNTAVSTADLQAVAAPLLTQRIGPSEIEAMRLQMTRLYVDRGHVNSGLLLRRVGVD
jgi:hemolysin activation/secretion protein